jgi:hypothetical protein
MAFKSKPSLPQYFPILSPYTSQVKSRVKIYLEARGDES